VAILKFESVKHLHIQKQMVLVLMPAFGTVCHLPRAMQEAKDRGADILALHVATYNSAACKLYQRLGFQRLRKHLKFYHLNGDRSPGPRGQTTFDGFLYALPLVDTGTGAAPELQSGGFLLQALAGAYKAVWTVFHRWYGVLLPSSSHYGGLPVAAPRLELRAPSPDCTLASGLLASKDTDKRASRQQLAVKIDQRCRRSKDAGTEVVKRCHPHTERPDTNAADVHGSKAEQLISMGRSVLHQSREGVASAQDGLSGEYRNPTRVTGPLWPRPSVDGRAEPILCPLQAAEQTSPLCLQLGRGSANTSGLQSSQAMKAVSHTSGKHAGNRGYMESAGWQPTQAVRTESHKCSENQSNWGGQGVEHRDSGESGNFGQHTLQGDGDHSQSCAATVEELDARGLQAKHWTQQGSSSVLLTGVQEPLSGGVGDRGEGKQRSVCDEVRGARGICLGFDSDRSDGSPWDGRMAMYRWLFRRADK
jgi:hypothetical protein